MEGLPIDPKVVSVIRHHLESFATDLVRAFFCGDARKTRTFAEDRMQKDMANCSGQSEVLNQSLQQCQRQTRYLEEENQRLQGQYVKSVELQTRVDQYGNQVKQLEAEKLKLQDANVKSLECQARMTQYESQLRRLEQENRKLQEQQVKSAECQARMEQYNNQLNLLRRRYNEIAETVSNVFLSKQQQSLPKLTDPLAVVEQKNKMLASVQAQMVKPSGGFAVGGDSFRY